MKTKRKILAYLDNNMSDEEKNNFESELKSNKKLASELLMFAEVNNAIREDDVERFRQRLKKIVDADQPIKTNSGKSIYKLLRYPAAALLVMALGLSIWITRHKTNNQELFDQYYQTYTTPFMTRSIDTAASRNDKVSILYLQGYYPQAHAIGMECLQVEPGNSEVHFYLGLIAIEMNQINEAIRELKKAESGISTIKLVDVRWYLAMAYLKKEDVNHAKKYLKIISQTENRYTSRAKSILKKIS